MADKKFAYTRLSGKDTLSLEIDGTSYEVSQFQATWGVNSLPTATCLLAVGRRGRDGKTAATVHKKPPSIKALAKAKVMLRVTGEKDLGGRKWSEATHTIFEGYFTGFGYRKFRGKVMVVANLVHWLYDLGFSSTFSSITHPSSPGSVTFPAAMRQFGRDGNTSGETAFVANHLSKDLFAEGKIRENLWGAIQELLVKLSEFDGYQPLPGAEACGQLQTNDQATESLKRITSPKALRLVNGNVLAVVNAVSEMLVTARVDQFVSQTFWDVILGMYLPSFGMAIVPLIDKAYVIADVPGFRTAYKTLTAAEYVGIDSNAVIPKPLRAVGVISSSETTAGGHSNPQNLPVLGGCYAPDDVTQGAFLVVPAPAWLKNVVSDDLDTNGPPAVDKNEPITSTTSPEVRGAEVDQEQLIKTASDMYSRFARTLFVTNSLRGRTGAVSGKLRFDIAPGSVIEIENNPELFIGGQDELAKTMYASVIRTTISINAESQEAATSFHLGYLRSAEENKNDATSSDQHPLFDGDPWNGGPLIEGLA